MHPMLFSHHTYHIHQRPSQPSQEALADLDEALQLCKRAAKDPLVQYDELPKVLVARGGALRCNPSLRSLSGEDGCFCWPGDLDGCI